MSLTSTRLCCPACLVHGSLRIEAASVGIGGRHRAGLRTALLRNLCVPAMLVPTVSVMAAAAISHRHLATSSSGPSPSWASIVEELVRGGGRRSALRASASHACTELLSTSLHDS